MSLQVEKHPDVYRREKEREGPLPVKTKVFYAFGEMPGAYMNLAIGSFLLIYYSVVLGASAAAISLVLGVALFLDAICDPLVGALSDQVKSRLGRRHPMMYAASIPMGVFICLLFTPPQGLSATSLIVWLAFFLIMTRVTFTFFSVPWSALIAEFSDDYEQRTVIASYRTLIGPLLGGISSTLILTFIFIGTPDIPKGQENLENYNFFGPLIGSLMTGWALLSTHFTRSEIPYLYQTRSTSSAGLAWMLSSIWLALKSRNYRILLVSMLVYFGVLGTLSQFDMFVNTYFWDLTAAQLGTLALFAIPSPFLFFAAAGALQRKFQKNQILFAAIFLNMVLSLAAISFRLGGLFPSNESPLFIPLLGLFVTVQTFLSIAGATTVFSMTADLAEEQEIRFGVRQEAVLASGIAFSTKAIGSLGVVVAGFLLEFFIKFPAGEAGTKIADDILFRLAITDAIIVNSLLLIPAFLISRYNLSRESLAKMQSELRLKRARDESSSNPSRVSNDVD